MGRIEIKVAGFGGQGMALAGRIIGLAAEQYTNKKAVFTQTYGPESRGGASSSDVIIDSREIDYPYITPGNLDYFIVMSKEAYERFVSYSKKTGTIFYDEDLVEIDERAPKNRFAIPATRIAEKLGVKIAANIVMLGFFSGNTKIMEIEAVKKAVLESVPARFRTINEKAFLEGMNYGKKS
ncbi:MAG: 2-oxoacid:acceptor oxidoreductase family protein [Candidatus Heimdallarchaeota archaeon]